MAMAMAKSNTKMSAFATPTAMAEKAEEIRRILSEPVVDLWKLRELALTEGGLVNGKFYFALPFCLTADNIFFLLISFYYCMQI